MKVCVLQPDYITSDVDYKNYDPPRNLQHLLPDTEVHHVFLNKLTTYRQLKALARDGYDIFVNLCEGYLEWNIPSIDVPYYLELLRLPYTGPDCRLYDPSKQLMKYVAYSAGVASPPFVVINRLSDVTEALRQLCFPMFVKPANAGDSLGIDCNSCVQNADALYAQAAALLTGYDQLLVEEYVSGREFTVLVAAQAGTKDCTVYTPVEYIFPGDLHYKTYASKTSELHREANVPCHDAQLSATLKAAAAAIFRTFEGVGYARLDFRLDDAGGLFFLEINFACSVFYTNGYEGSADYILQNDPAGPGGFLRQIIAEGIERHQKKQRPFAVQGNAVSGYGLFATHPIIRGTVLFEGEGKAQRLITRRYVLQNWTAAEIQTFRRYAYPVSKEVFLFWDESPQQWLPQNHSCSANTGYDGLNVIALTSIAAGEELTLDYAGFLDDAMEPFDCRCGAAGCRKWIEGTPGNSVTTREAEQAEIHRMQ